MEIRLLGPVEVYAGDKRVDLGPRKNRFILAVLALEPNQAVPLDRLVDLAWPVSPPRTAAHAVMVGISLLRKALHTAGDGVALARQGDGYALRTDPLRVDAYRFRALIAQAAEAPDAERVELTTRALALWRGRPLDGCAPADSRDWLCRGLEEARLVAMEDRLDAKLRLGQHRDAVDELAGLVAAHPLREHLVAQYMLALHRTGRPGEALAAYQSLRERLDAELGLEPGSELQSLHRAVLQGDGSLAAAPRPAPTAPTIATPAQLPPAIAGFAGRQSDLDTLDDLLSSADRQSTTVAVLVGTAGVGKTSLAVEWANRVRHRFVDGQLFVNLRGFDPHGPAMAPEDALRGFLDALGVPPDGRPADRAGLTALLRSHLAGKRMLVVLDNAATAEQVRPLLPNATGCVTLVTGRTSLSGLITADGARPLVLDVLTEPDARRLLIARLGADRIAAEPAAVDAIIAHCARLPLALSVVAARAALRHRHPLATLADELSDRRARLDALDDGDEYTAVRSVFSWSSKGLSATSARLFRLLGLHPGPDVTVAAAASLAGLAVGAARRALAELSRVYLIDEHEPGRFTFHDLLRAYAVEWAAETDPAADRQAAEVRLLDHYLHTGFAAARLLNPHRQPITPTAPAPGVNHESLPDQGAALAWFAAERATLVAAVRRAGEDGRTDHAWMLAWTCTTFFERRGHWQDLAATQRAALNAARRCGDRVGQANAHYGIARAYGRMGQLDDAATNFRAAVTLFAEDGDRLRQARTHLGLAWISDLGGALHQALEHAMAALHIATAAGDGPLRANALNAAGWYHAKLGDGEQALFFCRQALALQTELGDLNGQATTWDSVGYANQVLGDAAQATKCYGYATDLFRKLGDRYHEANTLLHLGDSQHALGDDDAARHTWRAAVEILEQLHHPDAEGARTRLLNPPSATRR